VATLRHPNIINLRYLYKHRLNNETSELWMIFPPMISNLEQLLQQSSPSLSIKTVLTWMNDIADALTVLHENELVHRNVVLSNIVLTEDNRAMLIDLGNWHGNWDLNVGHNSSLIVNGTNDDIKGFGEIAQTLSVFIEQDEKVSAIIDEFNELTLKCSQTSHKKPVTAEFARQKLKFMLDMF
jgi:serine/threonine protein kinase